MSTVLIAGGGTGGHLMPALAIAAELRRHRPDLEPVLVGAERGIEKTLHNVTIILAVTFFVTSLVTVLL